MRILVSGGRGFLGRYICPELTPLGEVIVTDMEDMNVTDPASVESLLKDARPGAVVHLAAVIGAPLSIVNPDLFYRVNTIGTQNVLEACRRHGVEKFVYLSSLTVHGGHDEPLDESALVAPRHPYAASKAAAEAIIHANTVSHGMRSVIFRPNLVSGPRQNYGNNDSHDLVFEFVRDITETGVARIFGEGNHRRQWIHPHDIACAVRLGLRYLIRDAPPSKCETFALGTNDLTVRNLAESVIRGLGRGRLQCEPSHRQAFSLTCSAQKARTRLGWEPSIGIEQIIEEIWRDWRAEIEEDIDNRVQPGHRVSSQP